MLRRENVNLKSQFNRAIALIRDFAKGARVAFAVNCKAHHRDVNSGPALARGSQDTASSVECSSEPRVAWEPISATFFSCCFGGWRRATTLIGDAGKRDAALRVANEHAGKENVGSVDQMAADFNAFLDSNRWDRIRDRQGYDALFVGANNCQELACDTA
jgi:hypothetical protein